MVGHQSLANFINAMTRLFGNPLNHNDKVMLITRPTFDVSLFEMWMGLTNGASLIGFTEDEISANGIALFLQKNQITIAYIHPGLLDELAEMIKKSPETYLLNKLLVGVEPILQGTLKKFQELLPGIKIINGYGPTETTVCATAFDFTACVDEQEIAPIGRPLDNINIQLVDGFGYQVAAGIPGHLLVEGFGVSKGYLNQPEATRALFNPDNEGRIWYETGDYACWLNDGNLKFMGRRDSQVKIRGYRIELAEIRNRLQKIQAIDKLEVLVSGNRIICFYCAKTIVPPSELHEELAIYLPDYMIPDQMLQVDDIPLNRHGKTDKSKLLEMLALTIDKEIEAPRTKTEINLLSLFRELLQVNDIGVTHNFFDCGGHSIIAIRLVSKAFNQFKYHLRLIDVFITPTVRELATKVDQQTQSHLPEITPCEKRSHYPLSDAQKRLWIIDKQAANLSEKSSYNMVGAFKVVGEIHLDWFEKAINQVIQKYEILRTQFIELDGEPYQQINDSFEISFKNKTIPVNGFPVEEAIEQVIDQEALHCFDLSSGELIRCSHTRLIHANQSETQIMVMVMHHIISDGWSMNVFAKDVLNSYHLISEGGTGELPSLSLQYRDYTQWYAQQLEQNAIFIEQQHYWLKELSGGIGRIRLPYDFEPNAENRMTGRTLYHRFSSESSRQIYQYIRSESDLTLFMLLSGGLALFDEQALLSGRYCDWNTCYRAHQSDT
jgi:hypothetical protein